MKNLTEFTNEQFDRQYKIIEARLKNQKIPSKNPTAFILGGQSGAGKSSLHRVIDSAMEDNIITIDNDLYKKFHPNYRRLEELYGTEVTQLVAPFSNQITEALIQRLSNERYNLTIEGTLRTTETPLKTNQQLKEKGYTTNLYVIATEKELSYLSTLERYADMYISKPKTARATPKKIHDEIVGKISDNLDTIYKRDVFNDIRVLTREGDTLYSMQETPLESPKYRLQQKIDTSLTEENKEKIINRLSDKLETIQQLAPAENETLTAIKDKIKEFKRSKQTPNAPKKTALQLEIEEAEKRQQELLKKAATDSVTKNIDKGKHL